MFFAVGSDASAERVFVGAAILTRPPCMAPNAVSPRTIPSTRSVQTMWRGMRETKPWILPGECVGIVILYYLKSPATCFRHRPADRGRVRTFQVEHGHGFDAEPHTSIVIVVVVATGLVHRKRARSLAGSPRRSGPNPGVFGRANFRINDGCRGVLLPGGLYRRHPSTFAGPVLGASQWMRGNCSVETGRRVEIKDVRHTPAPPYPWTLGKRRGRACQPTFSQLSTAGMRCRLPRRGR